jgi:MFS family permease
MENRQTGMKYWMLFLIFSGNAINALDRSSLAIANTFVAKDLHLDLGTMGVVLSAFGWAYLLFNLPMGWLCDRFGARRVYGLGATLWSLASAMTGMARGLGVLLLSRVLIGVGESANFPAATKVITERFDKSQRGMATGIFMSGLRVGFAVTPALMIGLMLAFGSKAQPNWHVAFYLTGLGSLAWVLLWFFTYRDLPATPLSDGTQTPAGARKARMPLLALLKFRNIWAMIVIKFCQDYLYYLFLTWLPGYLVHARHLDLAHVAFYATMPWIAGMITQPLIGILADKLINSGLDATRVKKTLMVLMQIISLAVVFAGYAKDAVTAAWLLVVAMAGESACAALTWTIPQDLAPKGASGTLGGVNNTSGAMAAIAAPVVTGYVAQYFGFESALALGGAITVVGLFSVIFLLQTLRPVEIDSALAAEASGIR